MARQTYPRTLDVPLDQLQLYPGNSKNGDVDEILTSLRTNGQYKPLTVREHDDGTLTVLAGNNTLKAMRKHGPKPCGVTVRDEEGERPCRLCGDGKWKGTARCEINRYDDQAALRVNLADNKLAELGTVDAAALAKQLDELNTYEGTGYDPADLDDLLKTTGALAEASTAFLAGFSAPEPAPAPAAAGAAPALNPFSDTQAPAGTPQAPTAPAPAPGTPGAPPGLEMPAQVAPPPAYGDGVHTGSAAYTGPGAPSAPTQGVPLPQHEQMVPLQWVATLPQRDTVRNAIKAAQTAGGYDTAVAALTHICETYLTTVSEAQ
ncbi:ParB N-terminal domain-containing protein [Streptomyces sp. NBC_01420]|uniref:ParB N-terminal domain-containing protein n=1 Tax=Streptomyces sp. NBC_01420 TaxID=2903858 RepID=UPI0032436042